MAKAEDGGPAIMAKISGPGPAKYFLRGTCGFMHHDPSKPRSPAYKLGGRVWPNLGKNDGPGPAAYAVPPNIVRMGRDGYPSYSLYGRTKELKVFRTPGPGESLCKDDLLHGVFLLSMQPRPQGKCMPVCFFSCYMM